MVYYNERILKTVVADDGETAELIQLNFVNDPYPFLANTIIRITDNTGMRIVDNFEVGTTEVWDYGFYKYGFQSYGNAVAVHTGGGGYSQGYVFSDGKLTASIVGINDSGGYGTLSADGRGGFIYGYESTSNLYKASSIALSLSFGGDGSAKSVWGHDLNGALFGADIAPGATFFQSLSNNAFAYSYTGNQQIASQSATYNLLAGDQNYFIEHINPSAYVPQTAFLTNLKTVYSNGNVSNVKYTAGLSVERLIENNDERSIEISDYNIVTGALKSNTFLNSFNLVTKIETFDGVGGRSAKEFDPDTGYVTQSETYNAANQIVDVNIYNEIGQAIRGTHRTYDDSGSLLRRTSTSYDPADGKILKSTTVNADGSRTEVNNAVVGKPYAEQVQAFDAAGKVVSTMRYYGDLDHTLALSEVVKIDGSSVVHGYDTLGREVLRSIGEADGASHVVNLTYVGSSTTASTVQDMLYATGGKLLSQNLTNANGTHTQTAYQAGQTLISTSGVTDTFKSSGGDTFVFAAGFGKDTVTGFHAGAAVGHDVLSLDTTQISGFADLQSHLKGAGADTLLTLSATDTILLKNVSLSSLAAENFHFQDHGLLHA